MKNRIKLFLISIFFIISNSNAVIAMEKNTLMTDTPNKSSSITSSDTKEEKKDNLHKRIKRERPIDKSTSTTSSEQEIPNEPTTKLSRCLSTIKKFFGIEGTKAPQKNNNSSEPATTINEKFQNNNNTSSSASSSNKPVNDDNDDITNPNKTETAAHNTETTTHSTETTTHNTNRDLLLTSGRTVSLSDNNGTSPLLVVPNNNSNNNNTTSAQGQNTATSQTDEKKETFSDDDYDNNDDIEPKQKASSSSSSSSSTSSTNIDKQVIFPRFNLFIEFEPHKPPVEAHGLRVAIEQEAAPCLIFQKHLLLDALNFSAANLFLKVLQVYERGLSFSDFSSFFSNWIVLDLSYKELEGFLLIPKKYVQKLFPEQDINKLNLETILTKIGITVNHINLAESNLLNTQEKINVKTITKNDDITKIKINSSTNLNGFNSTLSKLLPELIQKLFPKKDSVEKKDKKCLFKHKYIFYIVGHGDSIDRGIRDTNNYKSDDNNGYIASLTTNDALSLLSVLESIGTQIVYLATCFLGKKNIIRVEDFLNIKEQSDKSGMIVISGATTQILTTQLPNSFSKFFDACEIYLRKEAKKTLSTQEKCKYFATKITPSVSQPNFILEKLGFLNGLSTIPQIRFPGTVEESCFHSLAPFIINANTLEQARKNKLLNFNDAKLIYIDVPEIDIPIELNQIPVLILGNHISNVNFKKIEVRRPIYTQITEPEQAFTSNQVPLGYEGCNFFEFIMKAFIARETTHFFAGYQHKDIFEIKELVLGKESIIKIEDKNIQLPTTLYNLFVIRSCGECTITFSLNKDISKDEKIYKCEVKRISKQKNLDINLSESNSQDELIKRLSILLDLYCWKRHKELLDEVLNVYPDIKSFI